MVSESRLKQICIPIASHPAYHKRKLRVATIGAGFSGLIFAHKIQHEQPELQEFIEHVIFEANDDIGGTWKVNTYPGVQCDVPAHIYVRKSAKITSLGFDGSVECFCDWKARMCW